MTRKRSNESLPNSGASRDVAMNALMISSLTRLILPLATLLIVSIVGARIVRRFRDSTEETETSSSMLTKFREMRQRGELSEAEFRTIKTTLAVRMQAELNQKDESG